MNGAASYQSGRRFEWRVRDALKAADFWVTRSPGSKSPVDHVAIRPSHQEPEVWLIQCQRGPVMPRAKWNALYELAQSLGVLAIFATLEGRLLKFYQLHAKKDGTRKPQPMWEIDL